MKNSREVIETEQRTELSTPGIGVEYLGKLGAPANYQESTGNKRLFISDPRDLQHLLEQTRLIMHKLKLMKNEGEDDDMICLEVSRAWKILRKIDADISIIKKQNLGEHSDLEPVSIN
ncbi:hypothetical protein PCASD_13091 [Puccinia coronata f. sp. avenae]|uniref:Uncharacterized protein n=1 Tax=Puccinia coronata f. sp. avenae TaxID=200324 RepID=A0A2N5U8U0_9BASI|nr:hypothetical protein PCASD_13091 [Puccinia coronata f. sp. avenae]